MLPETAVLVLLTTHSAIQAEALVRRLGDSSFSVRESASCQLIRLGRASMPALRRGQFHRDVEVADRCRRLAPLTENEAIRLRNVRIQACLQADPGTPIPITEPLLRRFLAITGDSRAARDLYSRIVTEHEKVLAEIECADAARAGERFWEYVEKVLMFPDGRSVTDLRKLVFNRSDLAMFWFLSADPTFGRGKCRGVHRKDFPYFYLRHAEGHVSGPDAIPEMRRLFLIWLRGPRNIDDPGADRRMLETGLQLAGQAKLNDARPLAMTIALDTNQDANTRAIAVIALIQFGNQEDASRLSALIDDQAPIMEAEPIGNADQSVALGDLALAACIRLSGQSLRDFGFPDARKAEYDPTVLRHYMFTHENQRAAARQKWAHRSADLTTIPGGKR